MASGCVRNLWIFLALVTLVSGYKHVVFMHGILAGPEEWPQFESMVKEYHPGTQTTIVDMFNDRESLVPMWKQVKEIGQKLAPILTDKSSEGTILICFSQGGLVCRGLLSILEHNVDTFIALSSPLAGQFGDTEYLKRFLPMLLRDNLYKFLYTKFGQDFSFGNYWYDPHHLDLFANFSAFLGPIDDQTSLPNPDAKAWRSNFLRLKNLVLVGGPNDGVITPWQSSHFGMYDSSMSVEPMEKQPWYSKDTFGLKTLQQRQAIHRITMEGIQHFHWHTNKTVFENCVKPWLS